MSDFEITVDPPPSITIEVDVSGPPGPEGPPGPPGPEGPLAPEDILAGTNVTIDRTADTVTINAAGGGVTDHGALTGLNDPDHPIAAVSGLQTALNAKAPLASPALTGFPTAPTMLDNTGGTSIATTEYANTRASNAAVEAVLAHSLAADPHTGYQKESEKGAADGYAPLDATGKVPAANLPASSGGVTDHGALTGLADDDHPQYQKESEKGVADGYAPLDATGKVPAANLPAGQAPVTDHGQLTGLNDPDHPIAAVSGLQTALNEKAPLASPTLTGVPKAPTPPLNTSSTQIATTASVMAQIAEDIAWHADGENNPNQHPEYLTPAEVLAGANVTVTDNLDGTVTIAAADAAVTPTAVREFLVSILATAPPAGALHIENTGGADRIFRVSKTDADGLGYTLEPLLPGDNITVTDDPETAPVTGFARYTVTSDITDQTTYWQFNAMRTDTSGSQTVTNGSRVRFIPTMSAGGGVTDHGALTGLADDDHPQYALKTYADEEVTVATAAPTEPPARDGLLWVVVAP